MAADIMVEVIMVEVMAADIMVEVTMAEDITGINGKTLLILL